MGTYPVITTSPDERLIQIIKEDSKDLKVVHHINIAKDQDVRLGQLRPVFKATDSVLFDTL